MNSIYAITTHHERLDDAADAWRELGVCAIGHFGDEERLDKSNFLYKGGALFLKIKKGDLILAYAGDNRIAYIGEIKDGEYIHTNKNIVGRDKDDGGFGYRNQKRVKWFDQPYDFSRHDLPPFLFKQLGGHGRTVVEIDLNRQSFDKVKQIILTNAKSQSLSPGINEDTVKAGIRNYLKKRIHSIEEGLTITKSESRVSEADRPDFLAKDRKNRPVIIECKGRAYADACEQIERYGKNKAKGKPRLMLIAFQFDDGCLQEAKKNPRIELVQCDLKFHKV